MTSFNDILIPALGVQAVQDAFKRAMAQNEELFHGDRQRLVDFYISQQTDEDSYLRDHFNKEPDPNKPADYPHNLILSQLNITSKIIDKKAKNYIYQPVRKIDGEVVEEYADLLLGGGIKTSSKLMDRFTWLLGDHCVVVIADAKTGRLRFDNPPYYRPIFQEGDAMNPVGVVYPVGQVRNTKGEWVQGWQYWDAESQILFEESSWEIIKQEDNPHGCFNVLFTHRMKPFNGHWTRDAQDLVDTNRDINIIMTSANNAFRRLGFPNLAVIGIDEEHAGDTVKDGSTAPKPAVKTGFDRILRVSNNGPEGTAVDLKYLDPAVDWSQIMVLIKDKLEMLSATWNVDIRWTVGGDIASGVALKILSVDNRDDLNEMKEIYEEYFEVPLYEKILEMQEKVSFISGIPKGKLTLDWAEEEYIESPTERNQRLEGEIALNLTNAVDLIKEDNPDLDDAAALKQLIRNIKINRLLKKSEAKGGEIMDLLSGNFGERDTFTLDVEEVTNLLNEGETAPAEEDEPA